MTQKLGEAMLFTVTMMQVQPYDTGLYKWQRWTGQDYEVIESILLQVVEEIPSNLKVIKASAGDSVELHCPYSEQQRWSKIWCKQVGKTCDWVVHSDGNINRDYQKRPVISNNPNSRIMIMKLRELELWDNGLYQCEESGGQTLLNKVLLLVTPAGDHNNVEEQTSKLESLSITNRNSPFTSPATQLPRTERQYGIWDILRWVLLLPMALCLLLFSCCEKIISNGYLSARRC
ncbi:polymeric immunoglobulin receptor-like [Pelobates cultripes]|nr:polymeric immunoglobulin receptor-like [Pelobates cultripes]